MPSTCRRNSSVFRRHPSHRRAPDVSYYRHRRHRLRRFSDRRAGRCSRPSGHLAEPLDPRSTIAQLADTAGATLFVVGGYSSLRPAPGAACFVTDLSDIPAELHDEILTGAALITEDLPATPATLNWVFVSPALGVGAHMPGEQLGRYRLGDDVAVAPEDGGAISAADYALGFVELIENGNHHRAQANLSH